MKHFPRVILPNLAFSLEMLFLVNISTSRGRDTELYEDDDVSYGHGDHGGESAPFYGEES